MEHDPLVAHMDEPIHVDTLGAHPKSAAFALDDLDHLVNCQIAAFQDQLQEWEYARVPLTTVVHKVRGWSRAIWDQFLSPAAGDTTVVPLPPILLRFSWEHVNRLGHYQRGRGDLGLRWEIGIAVRHLTWQSDAQVASTVAHELVHLYEDLTRKPPTSPNGYHSSFFRKLVDGLGIPCTKYGGDMGTRPGSLFARWLIEQGLHGGEPLVGRAFSVGPIQKRRAKRIVWECACPSGVQVPVLVARGSTLLARCQRCQRDFTARAPTR